MTIPFNKPHFTGKEIRAAQAVAKAGTLAGNGIFTKKCHAFFEKKYGFHKVLLTTSCSDALEMAAVLAGIQPGDEVIMPSFTFTSTANAFLLRGAKVVFADVLTDVPNIDPAAIERLITPQTKAIVVVHYSGIACDMDRIMELANRYRLIVVEDAAHAVDSFYKDKPLGSIGHLGAFSFHETKNIISGEGGMLAINDQNYVSRAEIIWEKGTNRAAFHRGETDHYAWHDIGSSYLPSDIIAAFLYTQLEELEKIQEKRIKIWNTYAGNLIHLEQKGSVKLPVIPTFATVNGNMFYIVAGSHQERDLLIEYLRKKGIHAVYHYLPLHQSPYYKEIHGKRELPHTQRFSSCLLRLPFFYDLTYRQMEQICKNISSFYLK